MQNADRLVAGGRRQDVHAPALENAAQGKDIARIVIDEQDGASYQILIGAMQPLQHALLFKRQIGYQPVQEKCGFIEEPFGRLDPLYNDASRDGVQLRILLGRQLAAGEHHNGNVC